MIRTILLFIFLAPIAFALGAAVCFALVTLGSMAVVRFVDRYDQ